MAEFRFDIRSLFPEAISKITSRLLPATFSGNYAEQNAALCKTSEIIDRLGQLSAKAQNLAKPITTAVRLSANPTHSVYLLADVHGGLHGAVIGLLKIGKKNLYLYDEHGQARQVEDAHCILDFYIHESYQRHGYGKRLFEDMLQNEHWTPMNCTVDKPSEKMLSFLRKHYGLVLTIPQTNNFVVYQGYFDDGEMHYHNKSQQRRNEQQQKRWEKEINRANSQQNHQDPVRPGEVKYIKSKVALNARRCKPVVAQMTPPGRYGAARASYQNNMAKILNIESKVLLPGTDKTATIGYVQK